MIKDIMNANETVLPNTKEMELLKENFPSCFREDGSFDIERFKEYLSDKVAVNNEGYELKFLGKNYARLLASVDTTTVIVPDEEHNNKPENKDSQNVYISGDNLDGLKHLLKSYAHQVKCIYIDPPYNTGSDGFVYKDSFNFTIEELSAKLSIDEEQAKRILDLTKRGSASHSAWLMFMYPRLLLARDLLKDDGVIFISIDDNECHNLKLLCDDVFGEENFISNLVWQKKFSRANDATYFSTMHDHILCYCKKSIINSDTGWEIGLLPRNGEIPEGYSNPDNDPRGVWTSTILSAKSGSDSLLYEIELPSGRKVTPPSGRFWSCSKETFMEWKKDNRIWFGVNGDASPRKKTFLSEVQDGLRPNTIFFQDECGNNQEGKQEVKSLFDDIALFDGPKPIRLIEHIIKISNMSAGDIILDFFSGSASTANAVLDYNIKNNSNYKFIMIQLQELVKKDSEAERFGYKTIDQIGIERIIRAENKLKQENPNTTADLGFKHYTLQEPKETTLDKLESFIPEDQGIFLTNDILSDFGAQTVLTTWLVRDGYGFNADVKAINFKGYTGYYIDKYLYLIYPDISKEAIAAIVDKYETDGTFNAENVVIFGYSFVWTATEELKMNLAKFKDTEINRNINFDICKGIIRER